MIIYNYNVKYTLYCLIQKAFNIFFQKLFSIKSNNNSSNFHLN